MNKTMLQKVINYSALKNNYQKIEKDFYLEIFKDINDQNAVDIGEKFSTMMEELGDAVQISSKFFVSSNLSNFVKDNSRPLLDSEKIQQEFNLPFNKPLLIQNESYKNFTLLIEPTIGDLNGMDFCAQFFCKYKDTNRIALNGVAFIFDKNIFNNNKPAFMNIKSVYLSNSFIPDDEWENIRARLLTITLLSYLSATNLQDELNIFDIKNIKGLKGLKSYTKEYSYRNFLSKPVYEHKILNLTIGGNQEGSSNSNSTSNCKKRLHEVRGHLRKLRTGKICWVTDHQRGDRSLGFISKDYNLDYRSSK